MEEGADVAGIAVTSPSLRTRGRCLPQSQRRPTPRLRIPPATVRALGGEGRVGAAMFTTRPQCADSTLNGLSKLVVDHIVQNIGTLFCCDPLQQSVVCEGGVVCIQLRS